MRQLLWTRNFTIITLGTLISAIGGTAMNLALSLVVFDQTASTWLSGIFAAASLLPGMTLPLFLAPVLDRCNRKRVIVGLDYLMGTLYLVFLLVIRRIGFQYGAYVAFSFAGGCIGAVYSLTYECWYPDLIPRGMEQKGYAVSSMIYPLTTTLVTPLAALVYSRWGVEVIFLAEGVLLLTAASFEACIRWKPAPREPAARRPVLQRAGQYLHDMTEGFRYLKREAGIRNIYSYMALTNAAGNGSHLMIMAHFQSSSALTTTMYSLLTSAETIGRAVGAAVHYVFRIPRNQRYRLTVWVYVIYEICDGTLLFLAYPVMLVLRFLCGFLGVNTATLRSAAVQSYLPPDMRARVNGLIGVIMSMAVLAVQLLAGALGELLPYRYVTQLFAGTSFLGILWFIIGHREAVQKIYEFERENATEGAQ